MGGIAADLEECHIAEEHLAGEELHIEERLGEEEDHPVKNGMSVTSTHFANVTCHHERSHAAAAEVPGTGAVGTGCLLVDMGFHLAVVVELGAHIAASHMRLARPIDILHSVAVAAAEDIRLVAGLTALVLAQDLVRQLLGATQEALCGGEGAILRCG